MSFISDNVIPGDHGKIFGTNTSKLDDIEKIKAAVLELEGIREVIINDIVFPLEFTVLTSKMVKVDLIEKKVSQLGFHAIPKGWFAL